ncbi:hypothetical protein [Flammeovirga kamogawensis]|uniref:Uncharacterized protein n=1 Tax=Flammeovirga kamogawensis TaxID=373891 RepID=A0ABX8H2I9_9BACT|nr:hypothetical protein [Flammeovirga kamogawensis]MBB6464134.1 hypothetical protein [Flammeovirga kamogawensis]QWG09918.1 hypothetical protein KM029_19750 [Flammeovirga kamogawensis]TRX65428.1 hypothetical protein EO216_23175 [Flammeovirga kamogawensis]
MNKRIKLTNDNLTIKILFWTFTLPIILSFLSFYISNNIIVSIVIGIFSFFGILLISINLISTNSKKIFFEVTDTEILYKEEKVISISEIDLLDYKFQVSSRYNKTFKYLIITSKNGEFYRLDLSNTSSDISDIINVIKSKMN